MTKIVDFAAWREAKQNEEAPLPLDEHGQEASRRGARFYNCGWCAGSGEITSKTSLGRFTTIRHAKTGEIEHIWQDVDSNPQAHLDTALTTIQRMREFGAPNEAIAWALRSLADLLDGKRDVHDPF
jgi:hypothetical protein